MKKLKVVIGSVLKPVDDTRMYEKFGLSMSQTNKYEVNIIGFYSKNIPTVKNITFHPIFNFNRISFARLLAPIKFYKKTSTVSPEIIIINTHELLFISFVYKIFNSTFLIYDVRENYYRNLLYTNTSPKIFRPFLAGYVRFKEYLSRWFVDHYILAEKSYAHEFTFAKSRSTIIENKYKFLGETGTPIPVKPTGLNLIFTGTLATSTGVFEAIKLTNKIYSINSNVTLKIVGYSPQSSVIYSILQHISSAPYIELIGGTKLVSHDVILDHISQADFGIICYPTNVSTINTIPTKLYEYLGNHLPILLQNHKVWTALCESYNAHLSVDFNNINVVELEDQMLHQTFYLSSPKSDISWESEEKKLLNILSNI